MSCHPKIKKKEKKVIYTHEKHGRSDGEPAGSVPDVWLLSDHHRNVFSIARITYRSTRRNMCSESAVCSHEIPFFLNYILSEAIVPVGQFSKLLTKLLQLS